MKITMNKDKATPQNIGASYHSKTNRMHGKSAKAMVAVPAKKAPAPPTKGKSLKGHIKQAAGNATQVKR